MIVLERRMALCLLLALLTALGLAGSATAQEGIGSEVSYLNGDVWVLESLEPEKRVPLEEGQRLTSPVLLQAAQGSRLELVFPEGSLFRMAGPGMLLVRDSFALGEERSIKLELSRGLAWFALRPFSGNSDQVELVLPASVFTAQAVQSEVRVGPDRRVMVAVFGGQATVSAGRGADNGSGEVQQETQELFSGEDIFLESGGGLGEQGPLDVGSAERLLQEGEQVLLNLSGRVGEKRTMTPFERRDSAWASWNIARDGKQGLRLIQDQ